MGYINYKILKHELPDNMQWLKNRTILLTRTGSHAYGTNTPESDEDYRGVCIPPPEYYLGLKSINEYNTSGGKNFVTNGPEDVDITVTHINKFVRDALNGVPNNLDILFCRDEDIIYMDDFGKELRTMRKNFLSKALKHKFCGYAHSQKHKLIIKKGNGTGRQELVEKYGYDCYVEETRFLTNSGWKFYDEITDDDMLATVNPRTKEIEFQHFFERVKKEYDGDIYSVENQYSKCKVTPNHRMFVSHLPNRNKYGTKYREDLANWEFKKLEDLIDGDKTKYFVLNTVKNNRKDYDIDIDYLRFLGLFVSEGSITKDGRCLTISQTSKGKGEVFYVLTKLAKKYNIRASMHERKDRDIVEVTWYTYDKELRKRILNDVYDGEYTSRKKKHLPNWITQLSKEQAFKLLKNMYYGDGTLVKGNENRMVYYTNNEELALQVQILGLLCEVSVNVRHPYKSTSNYTGQEIIMYQIYFQLDKTSPKTIDFKKYNGKVSCKNRSDRKINVGLSPQHYKGNIVCFSVPNENLITQIDGKIAIQGNTKFAMHAVRLLTSVIEILETHDYQTYRQNREWLLEIRNGKYTLEEIFEILDELEARVEELYVTSDLPEHCDYNKINDWLIDINRKALDYNFCCPCQDIDKK